MSTWRSSKWDNSRRREGMREKMGNKGGGNQGKKREGKNMGKRRERRGVGRKRKKEGKRGRGRVRAG